MARKPSIMLQPILEPAWGRAIANVLERYGFSKPPNGWAGERSHDWQTL
jgi:hypothetical protein